MLFRRIGISKLDMGHESMPENATVMGLYLIFSWNMSIFVRKPIIVASMKTSLLTIAEKSFKDSRMMLTPFLNRR